MKCQEGLTKFERWVKPQRDRDQFATTTSNYFPTQLAHPHDVIVSTSIYVWSRTLTRLYRSQFCTN